MYIIFTNLIKKKKTLTYLIIINSFKNELEYNMQIIIRGKMKNKNLFKIIKDSQNTNESNFLLRVYTSYKDNGVLTKHPQFLKIYLNENNNFQIGFTQTKNPITNTSHLVINENSKIYKYDCVMIENFKNIKNQKNNDDLKLIEKYIQNNNLTNEKNMINHFNTIIKKFSIELENDNKNEIIKYDINTKKQIIKKINELTHEELIKIQANLNGFSEETISKILKYENENNEK